MRHRFHSMCPYFAMFPESFARFWIEALTEPGDTVLDPFAGRGTAPFEALLLGRVGVGVDINPVAACLNKAKLTPPQSSTLERRLRDLERGYDGNLWEAAAEQMPAFFLGAYHLKTLGQLLYLRRHLKWQERRSDAMISALVLGGLHGEVSSRMYLSNQMPRTISTKPAYSLRFWEKRNLVAPYRDAFSMLRHAASFRYKSPLPDARGRALFGDFRSVRWAGTGVAPNLIITSPPYGAVTSYEEDQWLRLWFRSAREGSSHARRSTPASRGLLALYRRLLADGGRCTRAWR